MKIIPLTQNKNAIIDDEDFISLTEFNWYYNSSLGYAMANYKGKKLYMHRVIMKTPKGMEVDHRNLEKLDNRKLNLRNCTKAENRRNKPKEWDNTSGYKGVNWSKQSHKWRAYTRFNNKYIHLGYFYSKEDAALAYNKAVTILHGEFARLNNI